MAPWSSGGCFRAGALNSDAQLSQVGWGLWGGRRAAAMVANWIAQGSGQHCGRPWWAEERPLQRYVQRYVQRYGGRRAGERRRGR